MSAFKQDGSMKFNSRVETIGATNFVLDNITINRPTKTIEQTDENDEPSKQVSYATWVTGSATAQYPSASSNPPAAGDEFTDDFGAGSETFYVTDVDTPFTKGEEAKVNITFRKKYN